MKSKYLLAAMIALPSLAFAMSRAPGELDGVYTRSHTIMTIEASPEGAEADDTLMIRKDDGAGFDFSTLLLFDRGHTCELEGHASLTHRSALGKTWYFRFDQKDTDALTKRCELEFEVDRDSIRLNDPQASCNDWCGVRGSIDGAHFLRTTKAPVKT